MGSNLYIESEWQQLIDSFPEGISTLEIVAACINKFGDAGQGFTFSDWGRIVRQYLEDEASVGVVIEGENHQLTQTNTANYSVTRSNKLRDSICDYLKQYPNSKAAEIAFALDVSRKEVNSTLYQMLKDECCSVNHEYKWCVNENEPITCVNDFFEQYNANTLKDNIECNVAKYVEMFANLSVYCRLGRKAPHKAIMLLSVMDLISTRHICTNKIEFSKHLEGCFSKIWKQHVGPSALFHPKVGTPFWHMNSEPFWKLVPFEENKDIIIELQKGNPTSSRIIRQYIRYAELDQELFELLQDETNRAKLRVVLIKRYL